jgi:hypothetical protein
MAEPDGHEVKAKRDKFDTSMPVPDPEWLGALGQEGGWAFLSDDHRIYSNPQERQAMLAARVIFPGTCLAQTECHRVRTRGSTDSMATKVGAAVRCRCAARCLYAAVQAHQPIATNSTATPLKWKEAARRDEPRCGALADGAAAAAPRGGGGAPPPAAPQPPARGRRADPVVGGRPVAGAHQFAFTARLNDVMFVGQDNRRCSTPATRYDRGASS